MASQEAEMEVAATTVAAGNSRLTQMKMRFQQKQMHEREQRRLELTGGVAAAPTKPLASDVTVRAIGNGKVRQMFDERRRGAGIDRSNPLKPIAAATTTLSQSRPNLHNRTTSTTTSNVVKSKSTTTTIKTRVNGNTMPAKMPANGTRRPVQREVNNNPFASNGSLDLDECDMIANETFPKEFSSLSLGKDDDLNNNNNSNKISNAKKTDRLTNGASRVKTPPQSGSIKLNPVLMKKSPSVPKSLKTSPASTSSVKSPPPRSPAGAARNLPGQTNTKKAYVMATPKKTIGQRNEPPPEGTAICRYCQRHFNTERLAKHEEICYKMIHTKRRVFDTTKHRVKGTEAEKFIKKPRPVGPTGNVSRGPPYMSAAQITGVSVGVKKNNWRQKHEEFIAAIRAAKQVKAHLDRGGKLSDLPPPPPSENPDYIQCPHCMRRFNQAAAERHIPKCATMLHNKPKPQPPKRK